LLTCPLLQHPPAGALPRKHFACQLSRPPRPLSSQRHTGVPGVGPKST
jgi:hypothetical protein